MLLFKTVGSIGFLFVAAGFGFNQIIVWLVVYQCYAGGCLDCGGGIDKVYV